MDDHAVQAEGLVKQYKEVRALDGVSLAVPRGTVLGVLGPNGAGKTTTVRALTTLLRPDEGSARVAGFDVLTHPQEVRKRIGVSGQYAAVDQHLTGRENLRMIGELYHLGRGRARDRADELLERFSLTDAANRPSKTYSGGMRRRLDLACALVAQPEVIFLDEPTTGLDPRSRGDMWEVIRDLVSAGTTLVLTTQYLEEADKLADDIVVVDKGRVIASGTADDLKNMVGGERLEVVVQHPGDLAGASAVLRGVGTGEVEVDAHTRRLTVAIPGGTHSLLEAVRELDERGLVVQDIGIRRPTLDDAFLTLTGHGAGDGQSDAGTEEAA
ncbi:ATP-binding cassette domain-containing protein [Kytococcus sedentarius]|uniref:ATP-binding cassette domain-containing protein n=1 Tax=Kytococcus sedentarius TaxID=1276 RepID=UPI0035BBBE03